MTKYEMKVHKMYKIYDIGHKISTRLQGLEKFGSVWVGRQAGRGNMPVDGRDVPSVRILLVLAAG